MGKGRHQISVNMLNDEDVEFMVSIHTMRSGTILRYYFILIAWDPMNNDLLAFESSSCLSVSFGFPIHQKNKRSGRPGRSVPG